MKFDICKYDGCQQQTATVYSENFKPIIITALTMSPIDQKAYLAGERIFFNARIGHKLHLFTCDSPSKEERPVSDASLTPLDFDPPKCKRCGKPILYIPTPAGRTMPVDVNSFSMEDRLDLNHKRQVLFDASHHVSHFATCPYADEFRKKKRSA